jgi:hypothetical protein
MNDPAQDQPFVLKALLAAAHLVTSVAAAESMSKGVDLDFDLARLVGCALAMSQISLASIWVVMGRSRVVFRWGALITLYGFWSHFLWRPFEDNYVVLNNMVWQAAALILAMWALHWRGLRMIDLLSLATPDDRGPTSTAVRGEARQFHLEHLFLITTVVAACVGAGRFMNFSGSSWRTTLILGLANAGVATALCWAIFSTRQFSQRLGLILAAVPLGGCALWFSSHWWEPIAGLYTLHCLLAALSLWIFRLCGYRLVGTAADAGTPASRLDTIS